MRSVNAVATAVAVMLVGGLFSDAAFAHHGGGFSGRGGVAVAGGSAVVRPGGAFVAGGGKFVGTSGAVVVGGGKFVGTGGTVVVGGKFVPAGGSRVVVGVGVGFPVYWGPRWYYPYPAYPYYAPYYYPYYYPPAYYPSGSPTYIEQGAEQSAPQQVPEHWWYYCADSKMYYPYTKECPGGWQRVSPQPPPPN